MCSVRAAQLGAKLRCDLARHCLLKAINNLPESHKSSCLKQWHISAMLFKSLHRLLSEALSKKEKKEIQTSAGIWQSCGSQLGSVWARQMPGPEEEAMGWDAPSPASCPLKCSGLAHPVEGHL